jgi:hypothetical protein
VRPFRGFSEHRIMEWQLVASLANSLGIVVLALAVIVLASR